MSHDSESDRFHRADALFDAALDIPTAERDAFVERGCDGDIELGAEVRRLLAAYRASGDFLEKPSGEDIAPLASTAWELAVGAAPTRVGPFRIVREVGRGGMGTVFLAERDDGQFEQRVALKIVRAIGRADTLIKRFLEERRILARLKHPHIAPLVDGGVMQDGTPWFAMEFVDGERMDVWCDAKSLTLGRRAVLFESVCEAVQYAHQQLVVHRDLKPSNILISPEGELKLLDFGIAKLLGAEDDDAIAHTATMAMTPQYAAPEQLRGEPITAATDVYALGVVLYELLAGRRPYELRGQSAADIERLVCDVEPLRPSDTFIAPARGEIDDRSERASARGTVPDRIRRALRGDLDAIVMQALRKDPARRYQSAAALLDDLHRLQDGRPVIARAEGAMYRLRRFAGRHAAAITALVGTIALLSGGLLRERTLRQRAESAVRKAQAVEDYMVSVFDVADPFSAQTARGEDVSARTLLDRGVTRIERELAGQPELQTDLRGAFGRVYANLGLFDRAAEQSRTALAQSRALRGQRHPEVAEALDGLGDVLTRQNKFDEAEPLLREALSQRREFLGIAAAPTVTTLEHLGTLLQARGSLPQADTIFREALAARRRLGSTEKDSLEIASAISNLAVLLFVRGTYDEAESLDRESLAIVVRLLGENHPTTAKTVQNLAQVQEMRGQLDEAEVLQRRALAAKRRSLGDMHPSVTISMNNLGAFLLRERGKDAEADSLFRAAIDLDRRIFGARHSYVAAGLGNLAGTERLRGHFDEAARLSREAMSIAKELNHEPNRETALYTNGLGVALHAMGDLTNASATFRVALAEYRGSLGEKHVFTQTVAVNLARVLYDRGELQEADQIYRGALAALDSSVANRLMRNAAQVGTARVMSARGQAREAIPILERAAAATREVSGANHWRTGEAHLALGEALAAAGESQRAEVALREAVRILEPQAKGQPRLLAASRRALERATTRKSPGV